MIGKTCKHKITGHIGKITGELTNDWGIYWFGGSEGDEHVKHIRKNGLLHYWQEKTDIEILNKEENEYRINN